ncbi:MAG TPA: S9 family peptidase [Ktedonobacteraceae bacterium]|nr:S9 family peptidase [Ktedonobacteraceae bacterium]
MTQARIALYGSWKSPITADLIIRRGIAFGEIVLDEGNIYWQEMRPSEGGRYAIVRQSADGKVSDLLPLPFNARTRVHEYGGGAFTVSESIIYCSNFADNRLYRLMPDSEPEPITPAGNMRYADFVVDRRRNRLVGVREDHTAEGREAVNTLVSVPLDGGEEIQVLVSGNDFYSSPRISPDGEKLAWLTWHHPNMPWNGTELWVGEFTADGTIARAERVAGGPDESIFQPAWSPTNVLHFASDRTGWWNLYRLEDGKARNLCELEAEFGTPQWVFGMSTYGFALSNRIICIYTQQGVDRLGSLDTRTGKLTPIETPYTTIGGIKVSPTQAVFRAGSPTRPLSLVRLDLNSLQTEVLRRSSTVEIDAGYISVPETIEFPTENKLTAYAFYYPPRNKDFVAPQGELPPLIVKSHGGPTGVTHNTLSLPTQYWTSRGFAVLDVNYGGSSGFGRAYRQRLEGNWGVVDVDDCLNGARHLVRRGQVDGNRIAITGGSAGGYTTLRALTSPTSRNVFKAGSSHFGVSDLDAFARETHKFESHYLHRLIGPYPQRRDLYRQRSPINYLDQLSCPIIFFQGLDDKIVPPDQAELMVHALRAKGLPVAYMAFEGEGHGFRRAENIQRTLEAELYFYSRVFGFELADDVEPAQIDNL